MDFLNDIINSQSITEYYEAMSKDNFTPINYNDKNNDENNELFLENVIDKNDPLDEYTMDDFFNGLPKTIDNYDDTTYELHFWYTLSNDSWNIAYDTPWGDHIYEYQNKDKYECIKSLYKKIQEILF